MIELTKVSKSFGENRVLDGIDLQFENKKIHFVIGKSGTGKSVLLRLIVGLLKPEGGKIHVEGTEISHLEEGELFAIRRQCGMVFQSPALLDSLSVFDNIAFGLRAQKVSEMEVARNVREKMSWVHLGEEWENRFPEDLSFGVQKRVSIARTLTLSPSHLLFDEPTTGLDPIITRAIHELISELCKRLGATAIVVSHDMQGALDIADRISLLDQRSVAFRGTKAEWLASENALVRDFLKEVRNDG